MTSKLDFKITVFSMPKMVQDKAILIVEDQYKFVYDLSIGANIQANIQREYVTTFRSTR